MNRHKRKVCEFTPAEVNIISYTGNIIIIMDYDYDLDTFGLMCPMPIMEVAEEFKKIPDGSVLKVTASDEGIIEDLKSYCKKTGHEFLSYEINLPEYIVYVKK